jgi:hypothetical protein
VRLGAVPYSDEISNQSICITHFRGALPGFVGERPQDVGMYTEFVEQHLDPRHTFVVLVAVASMGARASESSTWLADG